MKIRNAKLEDIRDCLKIAKDEDETPFTKKTFEQSIKREAIFLVAEDEKKVQSQSYLHIIL